MLKLIVNVKNKKNLIITNQQIKKTKKEKLVKGCKTLNDLINKWLDSKKNIKQSSYTRYYNLINQHIKNDIGRAKISRLNSSIINDYLQDKLDNGKLDNSGGLSGNTVYDIRNILKQVLKENNINIEFMKISKKVGVGKSLYKNDRKTLLNNLEKVDSNVNIGILLSLFLGIRESEVCGIRASDIDLNNKIIHISHIVSRVRSFNTIKKTKLILSTPKTEKNTRILPIPDKLYDSISNFKSTCSDDDYILTGNSKFMDPRTFYNHYKKFIKGLSIDYTYHDLRHTFETNCIEIGVDYKTLMELLGHASVTTTMNIYVHPTIASKRSIVNKL